MEKDQKNQNRSGGRNLHVRLTESEYRQITEFARKLRMPLSTYVRSRLFRDDLAHVDVDSEPEDDDPGK